MRESHAGSGDHHDVFKALALVLAFAAWNAISDRIYEHFDLDASSRTDPRRIALILVGTLVIYGGVLWLGCCVWAKKSLSSLGWRAPRPVRLVLLGLLATALLLGGVLGFVACWGGPDQIHAFTAAVLTMPASERVFFTLMGAKAAFAEETLFRGLLLPSLERRLGGLAAVALTSVIFGVYHRHVFPVPILLMKMALGATFAVFTVASRSLVPAWLSHSLLWAIAGDN